MEYAPYVNYQATELLPPGEMSKSCFTPDFLVILGRGIEKTEKGEWRPTRLVEVGEGERFRHTGRTNWKVKGYGKNHVIAGGQSNVYAARDLVLEYSQKNKIPQIIFAAGRPTYYLADAPEEVSEGLIMRRKLMRLLPVQESRITFHMLNDNRTTRDDLIKSLEIAKEAGAKKIAFLTIEPHVARSSEMLKKVLFENQDKFKGVFEQISFVDSWKVLSARERRGKSFKKIIKTVKKTDAYRRTFAMEQQGISDLQSGRYK